MNTMLKYGLAAAAVVAAILIGVTTFDAPNVGGPGPDGAAATSEPSAAAATPEPTTAQPSDSATAPLAVGEHSLWDGAEGGPTITVTIPSTGWYGEPGGGIVVNIPPEATFASTDAGLIAPFFGDLYVPADPCRWSSTMPDRPATTVEEVVAALQAQPSRDATAPEEITVDGYRGQSITLRVPDDAEFGDCNQREYCSLSEVGSEMCHRYHQFPGQIDELWILDVDGEPMVIDASYGDATPAEAVTELRAILDSMTFD